LEIIVHAPREVTSLEWRMLEVEVPDDSIETVNPDVLPLDWQALPSSSGARNFGGRCLKSGVLGFKLPSAVIPEESTLLLNPLHPDFGKLRVSGPKVFRFDPRF
jgi:RES domain-containing protein